MKGGIRITAAAIAACLAGLGMGADGAGAVGPHTFSYALTGSGSDALSSPVGVAVDNSAGPSAHDVYVTDTENARVEKFDPNGDFILMFGNGVDVTTGGDVCTAASGDQCGPGKTSESQDQDAFSYPSWVAVDSSPGPSAGMVYVRDSGRVSKFDPSGHPVAGWGDDGRMALGFQLDGLAVDSLGRLLLLDGSDRVVFEIAPDGEPIEAIETPAPGRGSGLAVDSVGNLYERGGGRVQRFSSSGVPNGGVEDTEYGRDLAIDTSDDNVYVDRFAGAVDRYSPQCLALGCGAAVTFGNGYLANRFGLGSIAVDGSDHTLYLANPSAPGGGEVAVFLSEGRLPDVTTGKGTGIGRTSVTIGGSVDPAGAGAVASCHFQYVADVTFRINGYRAASLAPCGPQPPFANQRSVHATLSALNPKTTYHFRVVAANGTGPSTGKDAIVTTVVLPEVTTSAATQVRPRSATVIGEIDPQKDGGAATGCHFEYVDTSLEQSDYEHGKEAPCTPPPLYAHRTEVQADLAGLAPGTTYRYRLVGLNVEGRSLSEDQTFKTPPLSYEEEPNPRPGHRPHRKPVHCSNQACTRVLQASGHIQRWVSPRFPPSYGWLFGVYRKGHSLENTNRKGGCLGTFVGQGMIATLNGCHGQFKLIYLGRGAFTVRWRVFRRCTCAKDTNGTAPIRNGG